MSAVPQIEVNSVLGELNPIVRSAAGGDIASQRFLRNTAVSDRRQALLCGDMAEAAGHAIEAMVWARLVASWGIPEDAIALVTILSDLAEHWGFDGAHEGAAYGNILLAEAAALLDNLADIGVEEAAEGINALSSSVSPRIFQQAKFIREAANVGRE